MRLFFGAFFSHNENFFPAYHCVLIQFLIKIWSTLFATKDISNFNHSLPPLWESENKSCRMRERKREREEKIEIKFRIIKKRWKRKNERKTEVREEMKIERERERERKGREKPIKLLIRKNSLKKLFISLIEKSWVKNSNLIFQLGLNLKKILLCCSKEIFYLITILF